MKSGTRNVIIVAACAVVLGGTAFVLTRTGGSGSSGSSSAAASSQPIQLISKSSQDVVSMKVQNKKGSYTLLPQPANSNLTASSGSSSGTSSAAVTYTVAELSGCPVNTSSTDSVVQNGFSLSATKNLGTVSNLGDYGLTNPQATVEVKFKDGSTDSYKIGNATATDSSAYYICIQKANTVYVANVDAGLLEDASYFVTKDMLALSNGTTTQQSSSSESTVDFSQITLGGSNFPQTVKLEKKNGSLAMVSPDSYDLDTNNLAALKTPLSTLTADSAIALKPDAAALKKYGFNNPTVTAEFSVANKNYKLIVGAKNGDNYYAMINGVNVVYSVSATNLNGLVFQNLFTLKSKLVFLTNINTVKSVSASIKGTNHVINVTRTENAASSTKDEKAYNYKVTGDGGKALDYENNYKHFYQRLISITTYADASTKPAGSPLATIQYHHFDTANVDTVEFYQTDSRHCTAVVNGKVYGASLTSDVQSMFDYFGKFEKGETIAQP